MPKKPRESGDPGERDLAASDDQREDFDWDHCDAPSKIVGTDMDEFYSEDAEGKSEL